MSATRIFIYCGNGAGSILAALRERPAQVPVCVNIDPPTRDKTDIRTLSAFTRTSSSTVLAAPELNHAAWSRVPGSWQERGREFRHRMSDTLLASSTLWVVNEAPSGMRSRRKKVRRDFAELLQGLTGQGIVCQQGIGSRNYFRPYQHRHYRKALARLMGDAGFWKSANDYLAAYAYEVYASPDDFASWNEGQRDEFLFGPLIAARHHRRSGAASVLNRTYMPLLNAYWMADKGYGDTRIPLADMQTFITQQVATVHARKWPLLGFAWNEHPPGQTPTDVAALAATVVEQIS